MQACAHRRHLRKGKVHDAHRSCCFRFLFCKSTHRVSIQASRQPPNALLKKSRRHKSFTLEQTFPMIPFTRALNHCSRQPNKQRYQHARTDCYSPTTRSHGLRKIFTLHLMTSCRTMSHCQSGQHNAPDRSPDAEDTTPDGAEVSSLQNGRALPARNLDQHLQFEHFQSRKAANPGIFRCVSKGKKVHYEYSFPHLVVHKSPSNV